MESAYESVVVPGSCTIDKHTNDIVASLVHLRRDEIHKDVKPYRLQYDPEESLPRTNCANETRQGVLIRDVRNRLGDFSFDGNGFDILEIDSCLEPDDFYVYSRVQQVFYPEVEALLSAYFTGAQKVMVMEHQIRKRDPVFPISIGGDYERLQPTTVAHIDFTTQSTMEASRDIMKMKNDRYSRILCVNLWKPLRGPVTDWPLGICDASTLDEKNDCIALDVVTRTGYTENCQIYYNPKQEWYYLNQQLASEITMFRQTDTKPGCSAGVPHTGFYNPNVQPGERPRESIEIRTFIYY